MSFSITGCQDVRYKSKSTDDGLRENVDFIQYWYYKSFSVNDWILLYRQLKSAGYRSIILQSTCKFDENGFLSYGDENDFFPTETVKTALNVAEEENFGVYVGLAASELWWNEKIDES